MTTKTNDPSSTYTVIVTSRVDSDATRIVPDNEALALHGEVIENPDGSEWGHWEIGSRSGLSYQEATEFCEQWRAAQ